MLPALSLPTVLFLASSIIKGIYLASSHPQTVNALPSMASAEALPKQYLPLLYPTILLGGSDYVKGILGSKFPQEKRTSKDSITFYSQHKAPSWTQPISNRSIAIKALIINLKLPTRQNKQPCPRDRKRHMGHQYII